jgi:hypothetical protein
MKEAKKINLFMNHQMWKKKKLFQMSFNKFNNIKYIRYFATDVISKVVVIDNIRMKKRKKKIIGDY